MNNSYPTRATLTLAITVALATALTSTQAATSADTAASDRRHEKTANLDQIVVTASPLRGTAEEPHVIWLRQPDGDPHTWSDDDGFLQTFEIIQQISR